MYVRYLFMVQDYCDRFYEDFYRVVVQNERFEDWFPTLNLLRQTFTDYKVRFLVGWNWI